MSMFTEASMLNRSILPRLRSEMRGWVTPNRRAAWASVMPVRSIWATSSCTSAERIYMFGSDPDCKD